MATKLQIQQSIKLVHDALITHLDSFKDKNPRAFEYIRRKDGFGIHYFYLSILGYDSYWGSRESNLGFVRLRSLAAKLTEIIIEDSAFLENEHFLTPDEWEFEEVPLKERKKNAKAAYERFRCMHSEVRDFIIQGLSDDRLWPEGKTTEKVRNQRKLKPQILTRVFISYAHEDIDSALKLYDRLNQVDGIIPWFDKENLLPGIAWRPAIKKAIRESDFFLALLSKRSTTKRGYVQTEMKEALEIWDQFPEGRAYLIPIRLEECVPSYEKLREVQIQDFFPSWERGFQKVLQVIDTVARPEISSRPALPTVMNIVALLLISTMA